VPTAPDKAKESQLFEIIAMLRRPTEVKREREEEWRAGSNFEDPLIGSYSREGSGRGELLQVWAVL